MRLRPMRFWLQVTQHHLDGKRQIAERRREAIGKNKKMRQKKTYDLPMTF
jgi:hypothetical protein